MAGCSRTTGTVPHTHCGQQPTSKWDIFQSTYALLHHPEYRTRYAANLKREIPRIPYAPDFQKYGEIGVALMKLHIEYEQEPEYPLDRTEPANSTVKSKKMSLSRDKTQFKYNGFLTLSGIPPRSTNTALATAAPSGGSSTNTQVSTDTAA